MQEEEDPKEYRWESGYEKTWETIQEDESGRLEPSVTEIIQRTKRRKLLDREASVRLGIMRHVYIILDYSQAMTEQDLKPTRQICTLKILEDFIKEFHDQNPISQLGIITTQNKVAKRNSDLSNNPQRHLDVNGPHVYQEITRCSLSWRAITTECPGSGPFLSTTSSSSYFKRDPDYLCSPDNLRPRRNYCHLTKSPRS
uniref:Ssl1-like domain-containing protein n=1 Tax=Scylla olivacea TaxID=85551 RepID=A0A0P4WHZ5_SCYOL